MFICACREVLNCLGLASSRICSGSSFHILVVAGTRDLAYDAVLVTGMVSVLDCVVRRCRVISEFLVFGMISLM